MSKKNIISFEDFEKAVIQKIIEKDTPINIILKEQYQAAVILDREFTGVGFFTHFKIPNNVSRITEPVKFDYGEITAIINNIYGYGFILFIKDGILSCLEGYTWHDEWPEEIINYQLVPCNSI